MVDSVDSVVARQQVRKRVVWTSNPSYRGHCVLPPCVPSMFVVPRTDQDLWMQGSECPDWGRDKTSVFGSRRVTSRSC